jgi:hypothetical protein
VADDESMIDKEQNSAGRDDEIVYFIEELRQNQSLKELVLHGSFHSDGILSNLSLALVGHPKLVKLTLRRNDGFDENTTRALCSILDSGSCMLSELALGPTWEFRSSSPRKISVGPLAEAIARYGCLQYLDLSHMRLDIRDLATLLDVASRCRALVTLDVRTNYIGNLKFLDGIMQTHTPSRLRRLDLGGDMLAGDDDRAALAKLVEDHPELQDLGDFEFKESLLISTPDIQYMLDLNRSGRVLLTNSSTPLSVWATVLERAHSLFEADDMSDKDASDVLAERRASVIYGLLRGPAFAARSPN